MKLLQMFLGDGCFNGRQILKPETVRSMTDNAIGDLHMTVMKTTDPALSVDAEFFPGMKKKHGFGFQIATEQWPGMRATGSVSWAGLFNYWWDPKNGMAATVLTQLLPFQDPER